MDSRSALPLPIQQALDRGWTVVTANQRAARGLRHRFDLAQKALGRGNWQPPAVLAWDTWTSALWRRMLLEGTAAALLLSRTQEHTLWRAVIEADGSGADESASAASLRPVDSLAELAARAWALLHGYRGRRRLRDGDTADTRAFARWANGFERRCARADYLSAAELAEALRAAIAGGDLKIAGGDDGGRESGGGLLLVGFDAKTPAQAALLEAVEAAGVSVEEFQAEETLSKSDEFSKRTNKYGDSDQNAGQNDDCGEADGLGRNFPWGADLDGVRFAAHGQPAGERYAGALVCAGDEDEELNAAAWWLRARLSEAPGARLAVIVPDLEGERAQIDRVFRHVLAPELEEIGAAAWTGPFEFSLGVPLARTAMVAAALDVLRWVGGPLPLERATALLLSPYFASAEVGGGAELLARAEFDAFELRRQTLLQPEISVDEIYRLAAGSRRSAGLPALLSHLRELRGLAARREVASGERSHAEWAAAFSEVLAAAGWARAAGETSIEYQTRRKWETALDELATLDFESGVVSFPAALGSLERIAAEMLFAPESRLAPVQIMGPLESAGSTFDGVWFLRSGDLKWPGKTTTNPLLPWALQRELEMPGVEIARDAALARRVSERIAASAGEVVFSYARETADGARQRMSAALAGMSLEERSTTEIAPAAEIAEEIGEAVSIETIEDVWPVPPPPDRVLHGGAGILKAQAECGFRAFAEKRLFSTDLEPPGLGLDPRERGSLVHTVLERFWDEVETHAALRLLTTEERDGVLTDAIDRTLAEMVRATGPDWNRAYVSAERQRLLNILRPWLKFELTRPPFRVKSRELEMEDAVIGPLRLKVRVDRVDVTEDGGEIILDYKTGSAKPAQWLGERPDQPQVPLYAVLSDANDLAAVAFASVRAGKDLGLSGYEAAPGLLPGASRLKAESFAAQIEEWRGVLTALAVDFHSGDARVSPKEYPGTCRYCKQRLLCRLEPASLPAEAIEELNAELGAFDAEGDFG